jgi:hypothetical protein
MTVFSGISLVGGIVLVSTFAFLNAPFKKGGPAGITSQTPVLEKKGLDYTPPPVARPSPATTTTQTPAQQPDTAPKR